MKKVFEMDGTEEKVRMVEVTTMCRLLDRNDLIESKVFLNYAGFTNIEEAFETGMPSVMAMIGSPAITTNIDDLEVDCVIMGEIEVVSLNGSAEHGNDWNIERKVVYLIPGECGLWVTLDSIS